MRPFQKDCSRFYLHKPDAAKLCQVSTLSNFTTTLLKMKNINAKCKEPQLNKLKITEIKPILFNVHNKTMTILNVMTYSLVVISFHVSSFSLQKCQSLFFLKGAIPDIIIKQRAPTFEIVTFSLNSSQTFSANGLN